MHLRWPTGEAELIAHQGELAARHLPQWTPVPGAAVGGCFVCFGRGGGRQGSPADRGWAAAVVIDHEQRTIAEHVTVGKAGAPYEPGLLALREGALLAAAVTGLAVRPDVLLVNATGRDHPRRAGLALHLGAVLGVPTVGVTHRPLAADGPVPAEGRGSRTPLAIDGEQVGWWLRTRARARPVAVSPGWRVGLEESAEVVLASSRTARTPEPIRQARRIARTARSAAADE